MKTDTTFKIAIACALVITITLLGISSCDMNKKPQDSKKVAEESNLGKFDHTDKEKDAQFLVNVAEINLEEIHLGELAQKNSEVASVKELGEMMEESHEDCQKALVALATKKSISIPTSLTDNAKNAYSTLKDKFGSNFDKEYCSMMVSGHKDAIAAFGKILEESRDEDIRAFAKTVLPELHKHLDHAITCQNNCEKMSLK